MNRQGLGTGDLPSALRLRLEEGLGNGNAKRPLRENSQVPNPKTLIPLLLCVAGTAALVTARHRFHQVVPPNTRPVHVERAAAHDIYNQNQGGPFDITQGGRNGLADNGRSAHGPAHGSDYLCPPALTFVEGVAAENRRVSGIPADRRSSGPSTASNATPEKPVPAEHRGPRVGRAAFERNY